jgi:flavin reductase (DIM6/NTAB) family NADH-FMN oxidoreductase RutF
MSKEAIGARSFLYPYPVTILGANVNGKANFMTMGFVGIVNMNPSMIALGSAKFHYTTQGIIENQTFSVNIPAKGDLIRTDYVGLVSGKEVDKSTLFDVFYGKLETAPMIGECPLCMECKVLRTLDLGGTDMIFIGEIIETYCETDCLRNGKPDLKKLDPAVFSMYANEYYGVGELLGKGWSIGKEYPPKKIED